MRARLRLIREAATESSPARFSPPVRNSSAPLSAIPARKLRYTPAVPPALSARPPVRPPATRRLLRQSAHQRALSSAGLPFPRVLRDGLDAQGRAFFEMEYVPARSLATLLCEAAPFDMVAVMAVLERTLKFFQLSAGSAIPVAAFHDKLLSIASAEPRAAALVEQLGARDWSGIPTSLGHGDMTLENLLLCPSRGLVMIDCDEAFASSWWLDAAKLCQDTAGHWCMRTLYREQPGSPAWLNAHQRMARMHAGSAGACHAPGAQAGGSPAATDGAAFAAHLALHDRRKPHRFHTEPGRRPAGKYNMTRPTIALVTGFTRNADLCRRSLAPLRELKRRGVLDRVLAVTWDNPSLDVFLEPFRDMPEVELIRLPEPQIGGAPYRKGTVFQIRNMEAALALVPEDDALIFKTRPDFVADTEFLAGKIANFDTLCAPSTLSGTFRANMPKSPFGMKIWLPWADANQPFFYEDGAFIGLKRDVSKLADRSAENYLSILEDETFGWFAHVVRFALPFLDSYPMFRRYLGDFHCFPNSLSFRIEMLKTIQEDAFFWHLARRACVDIGDKFPCRLRCSRPSQPLHKHL